MSIGKSLLNIRNLVVSGGKTVKKFVKRNPIASTAIFGFSGLLIGKLLTMDQKKASEFVNHSLLVNPVLNPSGAVNHILHPADNSANNFDSPLVKKLNINSQNKRANLPLSEQVKEFYKNGGKGLNFDLKNSLCNVVNADDGGKIYVYADKNGNVIGSVNIDNHGRVRNIARDNPQTGKTDLSVSINPQTGKVRSVYSG